MSVIPPSPIDLLRLRQIAKVEFGNGRVILIDSNYIVKPGDPCPVTIRTFDIKPLGNNQYGTALVVTQVIACNNFIPFSKGHVIPIPSSTLRRAISGKLDEYPLLVHLDSTAFSNWAMALTSLRLSAVNTDLIFSTFTDKVFPILLCRRQLKRFDYKPHSL